jgi:predicted anti-sigma-YlaC factor YlaD
MNDRVCDLCRQLLLCGASNLDGDEARILKMHLASCGECRKWAKRISGLEEMEMVVDEMQPPAGFHNQLRQRLLSQKQAKLPSEGAWERHPWVRIGFLASILLYGIWMLWGGNLDVGETVQPWLAVSTDFIQQTWLALGGITVSELVPLSASWIYQAAAGLLILGLLICSDWGFEKRKDISL